jgi:DNA-directed RNA polymerase subunit N (RpoN/RPB10)
MINNFIYINYKMIIPIKCFTCNANLSSKYSKYIELIHDQKPNIITNENIDTLKNRESINNNEKAFILLNLNRYCCRRHMISQVNIIDKI